MSIDTRAEAKARALLNDLSARRRVAKLFHNHQSMRNGVQERFVNTSAGNLTFLARDLMAAGAMPIVAGRVHDSALDKDDDFGPRWKLTLREEIVRNGARLAFTDASNSTYLLEIDGSAVKPVHPASTPVRSGEILAGGAIVLHSPGLSRRFETIAGVHRLVEARHAAGWVRLSYRGGLIDSAVSPTAAVHFKRRADGRIVAAQDRLGRTAAYAYDGAGMLAAAHDLAGEAWRYRYAGGRLEAMQDPRGKRVLHAAYDAAGRVSWIEVQGVKSAFAYRQKTTQAVDGLGRTTVFHRAQSGVTEGVESPTGAFTQLLFDAAGRPAQVLRDGATVAALGYDAEGRLASLGGAGGTTRFAHGAHGLANVAGAQAANYAYDAAGRVVAAEDASGSRGYGYDAAGFPNRIEFGDAKTSLNHDASGQTTQVSRSGQPVVKYVYQADGRVASVAHGDKAAASFAYDRRGLRGTASYGGGVHSAMRYDGAGNLTHSRLAWAAPPPAAGRAPPSANATPPVTPASRRPPAPTRPSQPLLSPPWALSSNVTATAPSKTANRNGYFGNRTKSFSARDIENTSAGRLYGGCADSTGNIARTVAHERHHVTTLVNLANELQVRRATDRWERATRDRMYGPCGNL